MREISASLIADTVAELVQTACRRLPDELLAALREAWRTERSPVGRTILAGLLENAAIAGETGVPVCQDTGLTIVFIDLGQEVHITGGGLEEAVNEGLARGTREGFLRRSCVAEPLFERKNTGDNTPAVIHLRLVPGDRLSLLVAPKGGGSENKSLVRMLVPADGVEGVRRTVLEAVRAAGPNACPPLVVGVGLGGSMELAALLAKRACVRPVGSRNPDPRYAAFEEELLALVNRTGIGPQGLGGSTTALAVHVEWAPAHIASLPVAVSINCNAARHARAVL